MATFEPLVSIVIPVYNGSDMLAQAIDSALTQTYRNIEVLVVDDGSDDEGKTQDVACSYGERIRYYRKENGGVASALNMGIRYMRGEYFSWLSHDDLYLLGKVANQVRLLAHCGDPRRIIAGGYVITDESIQPMAVMDFHALYGKEKLETPLFPVFHCAVNGCTLLIHRSHFERAGLFDESLPTTQDYELWFRMMRGQRILYTRRFDVISREHSGQTSRHIKVEHEAECTRLWLHLFDELTDTEMALMGGTKARFYADMYDHFSKYTSYTDVAEWLEKRADGEWSARKKQTILTRLVHRIQTHKIYGELRKADGWYSV